MSERRKTPVSRPSHRCTVEFILVGDRAAVASMKNPTSRRFVLTAPLIALCWLAIAPAGDADELSPIQEKVRAGDLDGALQVLEPLLADAGPDRADQQRVRELAARVLHLRGEEHFRAARVAEALADFDRELELQPDLAPQHWQRGSACYFAGEYERGVRQFERHRIVNPQDVESSAWHFLCAARAPNGSVVSARAKLLPVTRDPRIPMKQIQAMFAGVTLPEEVLRAGETGGSAGKFYADLYVGLYYEALGRSADSLRYLKQAAESPVARDNYMGDVARVHVKLREQASVK